VARVDSMSMSSSVAIEAVGLLAAHASKLEDFEDVLDVVVLQGAAPLWKKVSQCTSFVLRRHSRLSEQPLEAHARVSAGTYYMMVSVVKKERETDQRTYRKSCRRCRCP